MTAATVLALVVVSGALVTHPRRYLRRRKREQLRTMCTQRDERPITWVRRLP